MDALTALQRRERIIAIVRWLALLFAIAHVAFYRPPVAGLEAAAQSARSQAAALILALALVALAVEVALRLIRTPGALRRAGTAFLLADLVVALGFVAVYSFDQVAGVWAVLTLLPLEGALRAELRGALGTWVVLAPVLALQEVVAEGVGFSAGRTAYRLVLLLAVALFAGTTARDLGEERRLSAAVAEASRQLLGRLEPAEIFRVLCREVVRCLDARSAVVYVHDGQWFQAVSSYPAEALVDVLAEDLIEEEDPEVALHVRSAPVWLATDSAHPARLAIPVRAGGREGTHVLVVRPRERRRISRAASQAAVSLAEAAALALATTRVLTAEQRTNRRLRYLEALRTRFVATVAHDLRLPLTVFKGVASLLRTRRDAIAAEQVDGMLDSVERQANRLSRLADDLLDAARMDADRLTLHPEPTDIRALVAAVLADSEEDVATDLRGDLALRADPARLERVLWNLLSNAEKYGRPPFLVSGQRKGEEVVVAVRDHGPGITEEQRARLFSDFAGSDDAASVGLGLAIVWRLAEAHGGSIAYEDAEPGARFVLRLPVDGPPELGDVRGRDASSA